MRIYLGSDHGGFKLKEELTSQLREQGHTVTDCGTYSAESTDYPDFALAVGTQIAADSHTRRGILLCRSGEGMEMAANKVKGVRAALVWSVAVTVETRRDNDANVLVLPADFIAPEEITPIVQAFLNTEFSGEERHIRRLEKLHAIEHIAYVR